MFGDIVHGYGYCVPAIQLMHTICVCHMTAETTTLQISNRMKFMYAYTVNVFHKWSGAMA